MSAHQRSFRTANGKLVIIGGLIAGSLTLVVVGLVWLAYWGKDAQFCGLDGVRVLTDAEMRQIKAGWWEPKARLWRPC